MSAPVNGLGPIDLRPLWEIFTECKVTRKIVRSEGLEPREVFKMIPNDHSRVQKELYRIYCPIRLKVQVPLYWLFVPQNISSDEMRKRILRWVYREHILAGQIESDISWLNYDDLPRMTCIPRIEQEDQGRELRYTGQEGLLESFLHYITCMDMSGKYWTRWIYAWVYSNYWSGQSKNLPQATYPNTDSDSDNEIAVLPIPVAQQSQQAPQASQQSRVTPNAEQQAFQNANPQQESSFRPGYIEQLRNEHFFQNPNTGRPTTQPHHQPPRMNNHPDLPELTATPLPSQLYASTYQAANKQEGAAQANIGLARVLNPNTVRVCSVYFSATKKLITKCIVQGWTARSAEPRRPVLQINLPVNYRASKALRRVFPKMRQEKWMADKKGSIRVPKNKSDVAFILQLHLDDIKSVSVLNDFQVVIGCAKQNGFSKIAIHSSPGQANIKDFIKMYVLGRGFVEYRDAFFEQIGKFIDRGYITVSYWYKRSGPIRQEQQAAQGQAQLTAIQVLQLHLAPIMDDIRSDYKKAIYVLARLILLNAFKTTQLSCDAKVFADLSELKLLLDLAIIMYNEYAPVGRQEDELFRCIDDPLWASVPESNKTPTTDLVANEPENGTVLDYEGACMIYRSRRCQWQSCTVKWKFTQDSENCYRIDSDTQYNRNDKAKVEGCVNDKLLFTIHRKRILYCTLEGNQLYKGDQHGLTIHCLSEYFHLRFSSFQDYKRFYSKFVTTIGVGRSSKSALALNETHYIDKIWALNNKDREQLHYRFLSRNIDPTTQLNSKIKGKIRKLMAHDLKWLSFKLLNRHALKLAVDLNVNALVQDRSLNAQQVESVQAYTAVYHHSSMWYHIPAGELASCDCCFCRVQQSDALEKVRKQFMVKDQNAASLLAMSKLAYKFAFKHELLICLGECSYFDDPV